MVNRNVSKAVSEKTRGLYSISYDDLSIDEVSGNLQVKNIRIVADTAVYRHMLEQKTNPPTLLNVSIPALEVSGVKTPKALLNKAVEGHKIAITAPTIEILLSHFHKDSTVYNPAGDISKALLGKLLKISIDSVSITGANVIVKNMHAGDVVFRGNNISCSLSGLLIDSLSQKDSSRILFSRGLTMGCEELLLPTKNKKYKLHIGSLRFESRQNSLYIGQISVLPQLSEAAFARSFPVQKDRYDFLLEGVSLRHINRKYLWLKRIEADSLVVERSSFKIYRDLSYPRDTVSKVGKYPQQQLMRLPVPVNVRKLVFMRSFIAYKEKNAKSDSAGKVQFFDVRATFDNVTNIKEALARDSRCTLLFKANFLNKAPVEARLVMLLGDPGGKFFIEGKMGPMDARSLNVLTEPMGLARMERGNINKLHFNFMGTDSFSNGKVLLLYDDISISLLKKDKDRNKFNKKILASVAANFMMKNSNPGKGEDPRVATVHFERILNKSFFNLIWKTIFTGVKETAGIKRAG